MPLPGIQVKEYMDALIDAFSENELNRMLRIRLNKSLNAITAPGSLTDRVFELVELSARAGWDSELIVAAYQERPRNKSLQSIYDKYGLTPKISIHVPHAADEVANADTGTSGFEKTIKNHIPQVDLMVFREKLADVECWVCKIESDQAALGTGFLVGPDLVLTNYHVIESVLEGRTQSQAVQCRFDYKRLSNGLTHEGRTFSLHEQWKVDVSKYSDNEKNLKPGGDPLPTKDELDYALLRLADQAGNMPVLETADESAPKRNWVQLRSDLPSLEPHTPLLIAQHPHGAPMKLALDMEGVIGLNANGTRVRYATNTEPGASGSPCFDLNWNVVALHHYGDPAFNHDPKWNQGVPIPAILDRLKRGDIVL